jgi:membrane protein DedA with SNARE-associated domain
MWALMFAVFSILYSVLGLPPASAIVSWLERAFSSYGVLVVALAAFVEGLFMVSVYFPGSLVVVVALMVANNTINDVFIVSVCAWLGFVAALPVNYWLGREGFYRLLLRFGRKDVITRMQDWLARRGQLALFLSAFHPNILAVAMVCRGIARMSFGHSVILGSMFMVPWLALVVVLIRVFRSQANPSDPNQSWYFVGALIVWGLVLIAKSSFERQRAARRDGA